MLPSGSEAGNVDGMTTTEAPTPLNEADPNFKVGYLTGLNKRTVDTLDDAITKLTELNDTVRSVLEALPASGFDEDAEIHELRSTAYIVEHQIRQLHDRRRGIVESLIEIATPDSIADELLPADRS